MLDVGLAATAPDLVLVVNFAGFCVILRCNDY